MSAILKANSAPHAVADTSNMASSLSLNKYRIKYCPIIKMPDYCVKTRFANKKSRRCHRDFIS